ncbi:hypothetical protein CKO44_16060 [Rubrivivax gelatinosus]|uniref:hypothetical protein n=1 Tax=Rubrivivax gelatinosus TaxID=28068 RepID=UPI0019037E00|nr:hypothetical protein [Rubrivivax gelatinosus]MBK1614984.1 hypothetical protein [Rubrivivax gelatinosus]MBZ8143152.1 hypothetical protein [Rubrivivax gelatinosus]
MTTAFAAMIEALDRSHHRHADLHHRVASAADLTRTDMLVNLLDRNGPMSSRHLALATGLSVKAVRNLMDGPRQRGQVRFLADLALWEVNRDYDADLHEQLLAAAALLRRHGWIVQRGA